MQTWILILITSVVVSLIVSLIFYRILKFRYKEFAFLIVEIFTLLYDSTKSLDYESPINYMIEKKGKNDSIYLIGKIYSLLKISGNKNENIKNIISSFEECLKYLLADDIDKYKKMKGIEENVSSNE